MSRLVFDKYEIQKRLAVGGMGEVFYAVQRGSVRGFERPVILKSMLPDLAENERAIEQFLDEARVAATLNHPNVVSIYEVGAWDGVYYIAMEFISGRNLSQLLRASKAASRPVPPAVAARIVRDAALGLAHAHEALDGRGVPLNIVHRDVSPQNIMVRDDGVTKVVDFGIARAANRAVHTRTGGGVKGKLAYMAPEQLSGKPVTGWADQFSLGVVLWELCTQRRLFEGDSDSDLAMKVLEGEIQLPGVFSRDVPPELDRIVMRMLERDPTKRFPGCADVARELDGFLMRSSLQGGAAQVAAYQRAIGIDDPLATPPVENFVVALNAQPATTASHAPVRRRALLAFGAAFVVGGGGALGAVVLRPARKPAPPPVPTLVPVVAALPVDAGEEKPIEVATVAPPVEPDTAPTIVDSPPTPPPTPRPPGKQRLPGRLSVATEPWSRVVVDGASKGTTPLEVELTAGKHTVVLTTDSGKSVTRIIQVRPGLTEKLKLTF